MFRELILIIGFWSALSVAALYFLDFDTDEAHTGDHTDVDYH